MSTPPDSPRTPRPWTEDTTGDQRDTQPLHRWEGPARPGEAGAGSDHPNPFAPPSGRLLTGSGRREAPSSDEAYRPPGFGAPEDGPPGHGTAPSGHPPSPFRSAKAPAGYGSSPVGYGPPRDASPGDPWGRTGSAPDGHDGRDGPAMDSWGRAAPRRQPRRGPGAGWLVLLVLLALLTGGVGGVAATMLLDDPRPTDAALPPTAGERDLSDLTGVASVAASVLPSVVSIEVRGSQGEGTGSGFVLRSDGYILTNNHVVAPGAGAGTGDEVVVVFADGGQEPAEIVGRTSEYDLAVIKVERGGLTPLALADSDTVVVGDPVIAIGAPLGLQGTVTTGIVSALNRPVSAGSGDAPAFINAIQTDAAINPGNSGGPLVNAQGEVIGINSAIAQRPGIAAAPGSIGLGFSIPSNQARRTAEELIETGTATYPVVGVLLDSRYVGEGVQVSTQGQNGVEPVTPGGPADRAGIEPGDVITAIDGRPVTQSDELIVAIRAKAPGDAVTLTVRSGDGDERDVRVVLDEFTSAD